MKRILVLTLIVGLLFSGCATICSPTADKVEMYAQQIAQASSALVYFQDQVPTVPIQAIITGLQLAINLLSQARDGVCVDAKALAAAQNNVGQNITIMKNLKMGKALKMDR
jgi:uncharacterized protein YceK